MNVATTIRLPEEDLNSLRVIASLEKKPMSTIIKELVEEFLEDYFDARDIDAAMKEEGEVPWEVVKKELGLDI